MELGVHQSDSMVSLEETRLLNIARNNDFLKNLFGPAEHIQTLLPSSSRPLKVESLKKPTLHDGIMFERTLRNANAELSDFFPSRKAEVLKVSQFLTPYLQGCPALIIYGPSGCGKTAISSGLLHSAGLPHIVLPCSGFHNPKHFLASSWDAMRDNIKAYRANLQTKHNKTIHLAMNMMKKPSKFVEFALNVGSLIHKLLDASEIALNDMEQCFYVILDNVHHLSNLDSELTTNLLLLSQHSHRRIKVIALSECQLPASVGDMRHECVRFPAYTGPQLAGIVLQHLRWALDTHSIYAEQQQRGDAAVEEILLIIASKLQPAATSSRINAEEIVRENVLIPVLRAVRESVIACFTTVLNVAMPLLTSLFTHPIVLYEAVISCFVALYSAIPTELMRSIVLQYLCVFSKLDAIECTTGFTVDSGVLAGICGEFLPVASLGSVHAAVTLTHHLPTYSFDAAEVAKLGKRKGVQLTRPLPRVPTTAAEANGSGRLPSQLEALDANIMRMRGWHRQCPLRVRYLIISVFLAGQNPKETDSAKFQGERQGRRKKQRAGTDKDVDLAAAGNKAAAKSDSSGRFQAQHFSLERLLSIYAQVVSIIEGKSAYNHGDAGLYAMVNMLVQKGLLSESGNWSFQRPEYFSCVSYSTASELSELLSFPLPDYMHVRSNAYHGSLL